MTRSLLDNHAPNVGSLFIWERFAFQCRTFDISSLEYQPTSILFLEHSSSVIVRSRNLMKLSYQGSQPTLMSQLLGTNMKIRVWKLIHSKATFSIVFFGDVNWDHITRPCRTRNLWIPWPSPNGLVTSTHRGAIWGPATLVPHRV